MKKIQDLSRRALPALGIALLFSLMSGCAAKERAEEPAASALPAITAAPAATPTPEPTATPTPTAVPTPEPTPTPVPPAEELTASLSLSGPGAAELLFDGRRDTYCSFSADDVLRVECGEELGGLYFCWYRTPAAYTLTAGEETVQGGEYGFLYEFLPLDAPAGTVELRFSGGAQLCELRAFSPGALPEDVQVWLPPCQRADLLVFPTHADDDVIFFGAAMVSCVDRGLTVQVCYLVEHDDPWYGWLNRPQELLDALWAMGIRHYPVIGPFPDHYTLNLGDAKAKFGEEAVTAYQVEQIRRFEPLVVLGHDRQGEYGHGAHRLNALALENAVVLAADETAFPESAALYGVWDTPKFYLHFAEENRITLEVETPLESFGGRTAFEVAKEAMLFHVSQLVYAHRPTLDDPAFPRYDCRVFGLVRSLVGADTGNDLMENVPRRE